MKTAADLEKCIDDFKSDISENLDLVSAYVNIHDTCGNIKEVCTGGFEGLKYQCNTFSVTQYIFSEW